MSQIPSYASGFTHTSFDESQPSPSQIDDDDENDDEQSTNDDEDTEHDTLGLLWDDTPNLGGVLSKAEQGSVGAISEITTPELFPMNQIKIPSRQLGTTTAAAQINAVDGGSGSNNDSSDDTGAAVEGLVLKFSAETDSPNKKMTPQHEDSIINVAKNNLKAGMKASDTAAFDTAAMYFSVGRKLLLEGGGGGGEQQPQNNDGWTTDRRDTMLQLCSEGAHASYMNEDFDTMKELITEVLSKEYLSVREKFRVYEVKLLYDHSQGNFDEALTVGLDVRRQLGFPIIQHKPVSTLKVLRRFIKTNRAMGKRTSEELASLPEVTDERVIMGQRMLELLLTSCYQVQPTLFPILICTMVDTSLKYGINASACDAFTTFGILLSGAFGNPRRGRELGKAAELIFAKHTRMISRSTFGCQGFIYHWSSPLRESLNPLFDGYKAGLKIMDTESSATCLGFHVAHTFYAGRPLKTDAVAKLINLHIEFHHPNLHNEMFLHLYLLAVKKVKNMDLEENERDFDDVRILAIEDNNLPIQRFVDSVQIEINVYFGKWEEARDLLLQKTGDVREVLLGMHAGVRFTFFESLISLKAAQSSSGSTRRKWKRRGVKAMKLISRWKNKGNVNIIQCLHLLEAELSVLKGKNEKAEECFQSAIGVASERGFLQDKALCHQLFSTYFQDRGNDDMMVYHMEEAIKCYREWGASAVVEQLSTAIAVASSA